jgi:hypothetical protein
LCADANGTNPALIEGIVAAPIPIKDDHPHFAAWLPTKTINWIIYLFSAC